MDAETQSTNQERPRKVVEWNGITQRTTCTLEEPNCFTCGYYASCPLRATTFVKDWRSYGVDICIPVKAVVTRDEMDFNMCFLTKRSAMRFLFSSIIINIKDIFRILFSMEPRA